MPFCYLFFTGFHEIKNPTTRKQKGQCCTGVQTRSIKSYQDVTFTPVHHFWVLCFLNDCCLPSPQLLLSGRKHQENDDRYFMVNLLRHESCDCSRWVGHTKGLDSEGSPACTCLEQALFFSLVSMQFLVGDTGHQSLNPAAGSLIFSVEAMCVLSFHPDSLSGFHAR